MSASRTVYADGVFDLTHYGHHRMLEKAKSFGDTLIVGVHLDSDVATYKRTPILTHAERDKESCSDQPYR